MVKTLLAAALLAACLAGCQMPAADKAAGMTALTIDDLNDQFQKDFEGLRTKYDGKEVVVIGTAGDDFDPKNVFSEMGKPFNFNMFGNPGQSRLGSVTCVIEAADAPKFEGVKKGASIAAKGTFHVTQNGGMKLSPCGRDFRGEK